MRRLLGIWACCCALAGCTSGADPDAQRPAADQASGAAESSGDRHTVTEPADDDHAGHDHAGHDHAGHDHAGHSHRYPGGEGAEDKPPGEEETRREPRVPLLEPEGELDTHEWVAHALYRGRMVATNHLLHRYADEPSDSGDSAARDTSLRLLFASNVAGELVDCGCRRNPLGGLARRAQLARDWSNDGLPLLHVDAGNALVPDPMFASDGHREQGLLAAQHILQAFGVMSIEALAVGERDVALGVDWLRENARAAGVPLLTANWFARDQALGETRLIVERDGLRIGLTAVSPSSASTSGYFEQVGVQPRDPMLVGDQIRALRSDEVDLVVMIATGGVDDASAIVERLVRDDRAPDVVLISGSRRMMREPAWVEGIPLVESSDRGRYLVALDVGLEEGVSGFRREGDDITTRVRQTRTTIQAAESTAGRLRTARASNAPEQRIRTFELLRRRQHRQLTQQMRALATLDAGDAEGWSLNLHLNPVPLSAPEDAEVKAVVDAAIAAGWILPDHND